MESENSEILYTIVIPARSEFVAGKIYMGVFLAFSLFFSFVFGNLLFFGIVLLTTAFIFLSKERLETSYVDFYDKFMFQGETLHFYRDIVGYSFVTEVFEVPKLFLRLRFRSSLFQDSYIPLQDESETAEIQKVLDGKLREEKGRSISLVDQFLLTFFY